MIWFACKKCGKPHSRPESSSGTLVFCDCGQGNTVPWESTIPEPPLAAALPAVPAAPVPPMPAAPVPPMPATFDIPMFTPVPVGEERIPVPPRPAPPIPMARPAPPPHSQAAPGRRGRRGGPRPRVVQRDSNYCLNHQRIPFEKVCAACGERFCNHCVVQFRGKILCGPCKNVQIQKVEEPPKVSGLSIGALVSALALSPAGFCLLPFGASGESIPLMIGALIFQLGAFLLGGLALYKAESDPTVGGKSLALTAMFTSGVSAVLTGAMAVLSYALWV